MKNGRNTLKIKGASMVRKILSVVIPRFPDGTPNGTFQKLNKKYFIEN
jgi:hypothetical protein